MPAVQVATKGQIPPGTMKAFPVEGAEVLVANCDGMFYAVSNTCTHMGGPLSKGKLNGFVVECPLHGANFDVRTGANTAPPKVGSLKLTVAGLKSYPVTIEGEAIAVSVE
jgi:3-phenylpropionate/trans-cinnamate dioxygenase ferredoxin subunit